MSHTQPLALRMRPRTLSEFYGSDLLFAKYPFLRAMYEQQFFRSVIFYGPSGSGKTTFALLLTQQSNLQVVQLNAVMATKQDIVDVIKSATSESIVLLLDEIHRLNKDKQELLLPVIESGAIVLIGLTTVHPFSSLPASIRSRVTIYHFTQIEPDIVAQSLQAALQQDELLQKQAKQVDDEALQMIATQANGDIRYAMNVLEEIILATPESHITIETLTSFQSDVHNAGDITKNHYDLLSALQKSIRGSDPDAALYWLIRLAHNEDVLEIARRLLVIAFEDIAFGHPAVCSRVIDATNAAEKVGFPEAIYPLGYITVELALSPKSRTVTNAIATIRRHIKTYGLADIPETLKMRTINRKAFYQDITPMQWSDYSYLPTQFAHTPFLDFSVEHRSGKFERQLQAYYQQLKSKRHKDLV